MLAGRSFRVCSLRGWQAVGRQQICVSAPALVRPLALSTKATGFSQDPFATPRTMLSQGTTARTLSTEPANEQDSKDESMDLDSFDLSVTTKRQLRKSGIEKLFPVQAETYNLSFEQGQVCATYNVFRPACCWRSIPLYGWVPKLPLQTKVSHISHCAWHCLFLCRNFSDCGVAGRSVSFPHRYL